MVEPLVVPVSAPTATGSGNSAKALSYVALRSHDGRRVILPVAAAAGSRVLHGLFQGLSVMQLHQSATPGPADAARDEAVAATAATAPSPQQRVVNSKAAGEPMPVIEEDDEEESERDCGAAFQSYAVTFPAQLPCEPAPASAATASATSSASSSTSALTGTSSHHHHLLEVPIRSLETSTLARVAEFLVVKCTLASHPHYLHEADVFGDLDRTSERDQLTAMQVLLGADFLNC